MAKAPKPKTVKQLETELKNLFATDIEPNRLLEHLEPLTREPYFRSLAELWAPELYHRNRVVFRPFLLTHLAMVWNLPKWTDRIGEKLTIWLQEVKHNRDVELFQLLYAWKMQRGGFRFWSSSRNYFTEWNKELREDFRQADSPEDRAVTLQLYAMNNALEEETAVDLYQIDPKISTKYIQDRVQNIFNSRKKKWDRLLFLAEEYEDWDFYFHIYRHQVSTAEWIKDLTRLCETIPNSAELNKALEQHHPIGWDIELVKGFEQLLLKRGEEVFPYVMPHLSQTSFYSGGKEYKRILELAKSKKWWPLWATLVKSCSNPNVFNQEIATILKDKQLSEENRFRQLLLLAGPSQEWNFQRERGGRAEGVALVHALTEANAILLYKQFPDLMKGPFQPHVTLSEWGTSYGKFIDRLIDEDDQEYLDILASQAILLGRWIYPGHKLPFVVNRLHAYYRSFRKDALHFARRAISILGRLDAFAIGRSYRALIKNNPLTKLLLQDAIEIYKATPEIVRDLLETPEFYTQRLGLQILSQADPSLKKVAAECLDLLLPMLLRPLHPRTLKLLFNILKHADTTRQHAVQIHNKARVAYDLLDPKYPKEALLGLLGHLLHRWPELRQASEQPRIYERIA